MKVFLANNISAYNVKSAQQNKFFSKKIDISHNLKNDSISFTSKTNNTNENDDIKVCNEIIKGLYGEKACLTNSGASCDDIFQKYLVSIKDEYKNPATVVLIPDASGKLQYITIQEHKNELWDIGDLRVFDNKGQLVKFLSAQQAETLRKYRGNMAVNINSALRHFKDLSFWQKEIDIMNSLFNDPKIYSIFDKDTLLYRGIEVNSHNIDYFEDNLRVGEVFPDKGYLSATTNKDILEDYGNYYFQIIVPKGTKYIDMPVLLSPSEYYIHESEALLDKNSKLNITGYDDNNKTFSALLLHN